LAAPVYRPSALAPGMRLVSLTTERLKCGDRTVEQVVATYRRSDRFLVRIFEGTPFFCGDLGDVQRLGRTRIRRSRAAIYDSPNFDNQGGIILVWNTDWRSTSSLDSVGTAMHVEIGSRDQALAIRIGRGMRLVPR
jgi:hypothetical protein